MRVSRLLLVTLRDVPAEAEITSHQLLLRAGYIRRVGSGIYAYLPLMWRVLQKITAVVREEMNRAGAQETLLPQLHPAELWQKSGRWQGYTAGEGIMFHLEDRQGRELGLGPTHEEVITSLAGELLRSYRQLPVNLYQIQTKFRDEIRPRFGLMRGREFIMKDAYSFHASEADLRETYGVMDQAYRRIFERCGLDAVPVDADSGAIGGAASQEFMVTADAGEDLILISDDGQYAANQEKAVSIPSAASPLPDGPEESIPTPGLGSIESLCDAKGWDPSQVVKVLLFVATLDDETLQPLLVSLRGDQELNPTKVVNAVSRTLNKGVLDCRPITPEDNNRQQIDPLPFGSIGPDLSDDVLQGAKTWEPTFLRLADETASELGSFICGANTPDLHRFNTSWTAIGQKPTSLDLRNARAGDVCQHNPESRLTEKRGIEVGHIFQLGRKYSEAMESRFTNENGKTEPFWMGCYGIGVSGWRRRPSNSTTTTAASAGRPPSPPLKPSWLLPTSRTTPRPSWGKRSTELQQAGVDVLLDDRKERAGVKFKDADLIGIPWRIVVGRDASEGTVELVCRSSREVQKLPHAEAVTCLIKALHP